MSLDGKNAIISGSSRGLGFQIARAFIEQGISQLLIISRNEEDLFQAQNILNKIKISSFQNIFHIKCDISQTDDILIVNNFCENQFKSLDILINNASSFGPIGNFIDVKFDQWVETININLCGTARLTKLLLPQIIKSKKGKIINIVGGGASKPYGCLSAYASSKVAVVRFSEELAYELVKYNIDVNSVAPGPLNTRFVNEMLNAGPNVLGDELFQKIKEIQKSGGTPFKLPADLCCFLGSSKSDGITGKMISARFDEWDKLSFREKVFNNFDIYTLRRKDS